MTFVAVALALYLGFSGAIENTRILFYQRAERMIDRLIGEIGDELDPVHRHAKELSKRVLSGEFDPMNEREWRSVVAELPEALPQVTAVAFIGLDLQARVYNRDEGVVAKRDFSMMPKATKLFGAHRKSREPRWLRPLWSPTVGKAIIALATPLYRVDELLGFHVAVIALTDFSERITESMNDSGLTPYVLYGNEWLLAHPAIIGWIPSTSLFSSDVAFTSGDEAAFLPGLDTFDGELIEHFWEAEPARLFADVIVGGTRISRFSRNGEHEIFVYRGLKDYGDREWIVGTHFSSDLLAPEIDRIWNYGLVSAVVLLMAVLAAAAIGGLTSKPIRRLAEAARRAHAEDLDAAPRLSGSAIRELDDASLSFNEMITGLKERARIRNLFGKYVPESIAAKMLAGEDGVEPQSAEATILFVDLEGFTGLSETLRPAEIAKLLNEYFSTVVEIIERNKGVVTQFQGDAILAIFNVPVRDEAHQMNAVRAAVEMRRAVSERTFIGRRLAIRVGVNTGEVFAGNVGASDRLNYTVHGDAVNIAARLEAMNKEFGTRILIGETTAASLSGIDLRPVPAATIRGKTQVVDVFEVRDGA